MGEDTVIITLDLPPGWTWAWYASENVIGLASGLDEAGRARALDELQAHWRRRLAPRRSQENYAAELA